MKTTIKIILSVLLFILSTTEFGYAQRKKENLSSSYKISDCEGAILITKVGDYSVGFTSNSGKFLDMGKENAYQLNQETNSIWYRFVAPYDCKLSLQIDAPINNIEFTAFKTTSTVCSSLNDGSAEKLFHKVLDKSGHSFNGEEDAFLQINKGETVVFYFNSKELSKKELGFKVQIEAVNFDEAVKQLMEKIDLRRDFSQKTFHIAIRDKITKLPVSARIIIRNSKLFDALYSGSDIKFNVDRTFKYDISIDAVGYFPRDTSMRITELSGNILHEFFVTPVVKGKKVKLEGIGFMPQSDVFRDDAPAKLQRLRDFMVLNPSVSIEVQGHVHRVGSNSFGARRLSKKRAKRVVKFLRKAGVEKSRLSFVGFGNSQMLYPEAKSNAEEQANRRVEIKILSVEEEE